MQKNPGKGRKIILRLLKYTLFSILFLLITLYFILQMHSVQTWLGKEASAYLSHELNTRISIEKVKINFFKKADLEGIYAEDLHHDTLLYGSRLNVEIRLLSLRKEKLELDLTRLEGVTCKLQRYKGEKGLNFQFIADYFSGNETKKDTTPSKFKITYGDLHLAHVRFVYRDHNDTTKQAYGVNFSDIEANNITGRISGIKISGDSVQCMVDHLSLREKSGLHVKKLSALATVSPRKVTAEKLLLLTDKSYLHGYYRMLTDSFADYDDFLKNVDLEARLDDSSYVNPSDISYFTDALRGLDKKININGLIKGPVSNLNSDNLTLSTGQHTSFKGKFIIKGLPDMEKTFLSLEAGRLSTSSIDVANIPSYPFYEGKQMELPANMAKLGKITFTGKAEGFINDIFLDGILSTALGRIHTEAAVSSKGKELSYNGKFRTENFNVGRFLDVTDLDEVSLTAAVNGKGTTLNTLSASIDGTIQSLRYNKYQYHTMLVSGAFKNRVFNGHFVSSDPHANLEFTGNVDFSKRIPQINADINLFKLDLYATHFVKKDSISIFSGRLNMNLTGENIDNLNGTLQAGHLKLVKSNGVVQLDNTDISIEENEKQNVLSVISSVADAEVTGHFKPSTLGKSISYFLDDYFPTFFHEDKKSRGKAKTTDDNLSFKIRVKDFDPVARLLDLPVSVSANSVLQGAFDARNNTLNASGVSDKIEYNKMPVREWFLSINTANKEVKLNTGFKRLDLADSVYVGNFNFESTSTDNRSNFQLLWDNQSRHKNSGEIDGNLVFSQGALDLDLGKFLIYAEDSLWTMTGNDHFVMDSSGIINFHDLDFANGNQAIRLEGVISKNPKDKFVVELENFRLKQLNPLLKRSGVSLQGAVTGNASISDLYNKVTFSSALNFRQLSVNNTLIGTGELNSLYDKTKNVVSINGFFKRDFEKISESSYNNIQFDGYYYPEEKINSLDINIHLYQFGIAVLQPFVTDIFTFGQGSLNGEIKITGSPSKIQMNGGMDLQNVTNFKVDYLNTVYSAKGHISIEPDKMVFENIVLTDVHGNTATVWGDIFHDNFSNMKLDFDINTKNFMALNTTSLQNSSYYGKAFCTGNIGLYGPPDALTFEINAKTAKGTQFFIPLAGPEEVSDNGYIRFVRIDSLKNTHGSKNDFSGITLKFNLEATPDAEVQILFDAKAGDAIKARGSGNINMNISTLGNFEMFGTYTISEGSYLFTLENVINKKFDIDNGSTIRWSGDPLNADINITATYKQRASLAAFFPQTTDQSGSTTGGSSGAGVDNNKRYPVNCKLYMRDKLMTPDISFGIELPSVSEVIRSQVMSYINNDQELNRQVFSLLLLRTFVTPLSLSNPSGVNAGDAVGNNASELLSNQLNNWLSHFTKTFNLGVNYRPGSAQSNEELDVAVSTQLFNDRLTVDGNVGVNNNNQTRTSTLIGDINVNYKLTNDGRIQLKAFNRSNDNFQIATLGGQFTQGAGVFYREEFNSLNDLYRRYLHFLARKKKKAADTSNTATSN